MKKDGWVYIMANTRPSLYTGVTNNLIRRIYEHRHDLSPCFTSQYKIHKLVWFETHETITTAIIREKHIKDMSRKDKLNMIRVTNPALKDLYYEILESLRSPE